GRVQRLERCAELVVEKGDAPLLVVHGNDDRDHAGEVTRRRRGSARLRSAANGGAALAGGGAGSRARAGASASRRGGAPRRRGGARALGGRPGGSRPAAVSELRDGGFRLAGGG